ncbi:MAG: PaaI family thioesterase [Polyangiaceae bacterium]|nr:PaaI family thioesterase [Polyangiaceae bacterium]
MTVRALVRLARETRDLSSLVRAIPYLGWMNIEARIEDDAVVCSMRFKPSHIGNPALPALHGGTLAALLETTAALQVLWELGEAALPKIVTLTIDYPRSARPEDAHCRARITRRGRRVVNVHAEVYQADPDKPVTSANLHFLIEQPETP